MSAHEKDWLGPDPYEVIKGYKKLPSYKCSLCGERYPAEELKDAEDLDYSTGEWHARQLCFDCAKKVDGQSDWRVF